MKLPDRIESKIERIPECGCWIWTGAMHRNGYGKIKASNSRKVTFPHRVVFELVKGKIPDGLQIDHLCRVRACVNPEHLEPVTSRENLRRAGIIDALVARAKSIKQEGVCSQGHSLTPENVYTYPGTGASHCRQCHAARQKQWQKNNREKVNELKRARRLRIKFAQAA